VTTVALAGDLAEAFQQVSATAGVARIASPEGKVLLVGRAANLRKWAERNLGRGKPAKKGGRPPVDLSPVAGALVFQQTTSEFQQRLVYERWMAPLVPIDKRRDLKPPVFLRLDPDERFPRVTLHVGTPSDPRCLYGPFRDRKSAEKTSSVLHKLHRLRPCDFVFEPDPALPLGLGCVYAQVRSCAAPCLARVSEPEYRLLAAQAAGLLGGESMDGRPAWVARAGADAVVVAPRVAGVELYPVRAGAVLEERLVVADTLEAGLSKLSFDSPATPPDDWPWLLSWLAAPKRKGDFLVLRDGPA